MVIDLNNSYQMLNNKIYGRTVQAKAVIKAIMRRVKEKDPNASSFTAGSKSLLDKSRANELRPFTVLVSGARGMGKSLFSRNILINLKQLELLVAQQVKQH